MPSPSTNPPGASVAFGSFVLDTVQGCLLHCGEVVTLRRKAWETLRYLALRPGTVVSNEELLDTVWPGVAVTPQTLTNVIRELRVALDDSARPPRFLRTIYGRGHVFLGATDNASSPAMSEPLVGREKELEFLTSAWRRVGDGGSRTVFVVGEPGFGKTTLADAWVGSLARVAEPQPRVLRGTCVEQHGHPEPYLPFLEIVETLTRTEPTALAGFHDVAPTWLLQMPHLLAVSEREELERALSSASPVRMLREGVALFVRAAAERPTLCILEDLHWADLATIDLVAALARRGVPHLCVIATYRDRSPQSGSPSLALHDTARDLVDGGHATRLPLAPFDREDVRAFVAARLGDGALAESLTPLLDARSAGNPLLLRTLIDQMQSDGTLRRGGRSWALAAGRGTLQGETPRGLEDIVGARVAALPLRVRAVLEAASVVGRIFSVQEVADSLGSSQASVGEDCDELCAAHGLIVAEGRLGLPDGSETSRYAFRHDAYRRVVLDLLATTRRRALHRAVASGLERTSVQNPDRASARLAAHFIEGDEPLKALRYLERAARQAERRFAYRESAACLRAALALLDSPGDVPAAQREHAGHLALWLGNTLTLIAGYSAPEVGEAFARAQSLFAAAGSTGGAFLAGLGMARWTLTRAEYPAAHVHVERLLELGRAMGAEGQAGACCWAGFAASAMGQLPRARLLLEEGLQAAAGRSVLPHHDVERAILSQLGLVRTVMGETDQGRSLIHEAVASSRRGGRPGEVVHACLVAAEYAIFTRRREEGRAFAREALAGAADNGLPSFVPLARLYEAWFDHGRPAPERIATMQDALDERRRLGDGWHRSMALAMMAEVQLEAGDARGAEATLKAAAADIETTGERHYESEIHRLRGVCALALDPTESGRSRAASWRERAAAVARSQQARLWEQRAASAPALSRPWL